MKAKQYIALLLCGCAENPDSGIVVHKDMDKVIGEAQQTGESKADIGDLQQYDSYTADIKNDSLQVSIHADAQVDIPQPDKFSIFRVRQNEFTDADIEPFRAYFFGDAELYDGAALSQQTKADLEPQIASARAALDEVSAGVPKNENEKHDRAVYLQETQQHLDNLQAQYDAASAEAPKIRTDGKLQNAAEKLASGENPTYWKWENDLGCKEIADMRTADNHAALCVQNNPNFGNSIVYSASPVGTEFMSVLGGGHTLEQAQVTAGSELPVLGAPNPDAALTPIPGDSAELSQEDAQKLAEAFLHTIGLDDFACSNGGKYRVWLDLRLNDAEYMRTCYVLQYERCIDSVMLDQNSGMKFDESLKGDSYRKQQWPGEMIEFQINDAGIVGFCWNAALDITETVVEQAALNPFSEICDTFEKIMPMIAAPSETAVFPTEINIDRVSLSYSRISEKDSFDTGLIVPVWGFLGSRKSDNYKETMTGVQLAVNAIDGSVIDSALGY